MAYDNYNDKDQYSTYAGESPYALLAEMQSIKGTVSLKANKIDIVGMVTFTNLSTAGQTTINGANITTGVLDASRVYVTNLDADNIKTGTLNGIRFVSPNLTDVTLTSQGNAIEIGPSSSQMVIDSNEFQARSNGSPASIGINLNGGDVYIGDAAHKLRISTDGTGEYFSSIASYNRTYSSAANVYVTSNGVIGRSTSASKYKLNINKVEDNFKKILNLQPKKWYDKSASEHYSAYLSSLTTDNPMNFKEEDIPYLKEHHGLIAEDLVECGLDQFVSYNYKEDGTKEVEGIEYDRLWVYLIPIIKEQQERIKSLESVINT